MNPLLLLLIIGLICSAFASTAETALTSVSRIRIRSLAEEGDRRAKHLLRHDGCGAGGDDYRDGIDGQDG